MPRNRAKRRNATPFGVAFCCPALVTGLPNRLVDGGYIHRTYCKLSRPVHPLLRAASLAVALAGRLLFFGLAGYFSSSRYITGTLYIAITGPFKMPFHFNHLRHRVQGDCLHSGMPPHTGIPNTIDTRPIADTEGSSAFPFLRAQFA
jgi:hypothetical protein